MRECGKFSKGLWAVLLLVLVLIGTGSAYAFNIPTGNDDLVLRWDNTVRYTMMYRLLDPDSSFLDSGDGGVTVVNPYGPLVPPSMGGGVPGQPAFLFGNGASTRFGNVNGDDGNRNFDHGMVSNRIDLLSEADLVFKKSYGVRVSGAFWFDQRYRDHFYNSSAATSNLDFNGSTGNLGGLSDYADNRYAGPSGELLDAFVFAKIDAGSVPLYFKLGRHIYSWGQGLLNPMYAISYGQMPLDLGKAQANPGIESKELFRPTNMVSLVAQITPTLQVAGQFYLQRERNILPAEGTYFATNDVALDGEGHMIFAGQNIIHGLDVEGKRWHDYGIAVQWSPIADGDTTFGFYYRRFTDRMPSLFITVDPTGYQYHAAYKSDIDLYGVSLATVLGGFSIGAEVSYREHMPLLQTRPNGLGGATHASLVPSDGEIYGPTGQVLFALVNFMNMLKKTPLWDAGTYMAEFDYCRWMSVDGGMTSDSFDSFHTLYLYGLSSSDVPLANFAGNSDGWGRVTRDAMTATFVFSPQYLQILPGLDLTVPISLSYGLFGHAAVAGGNAEGDGNFGIGLNFDYLSTYKLNFTYSNYFGKVHEDGWFGTVTRGSYASMKDRDFISMTFKVSF